MCISLRQLLYFCFLAFSSDVLEAINMFARMRLSAEADCPKHTWPQRRRNTATFRGLWTRSPPPS